MKNKTNPEAKSSESISTEARREFLHKAAKVGIATPAAVTLMLAAGNKRARAGAVEVYCPPCPA